MAMRISGPSMRRVSIWGSVSIDGNLGKITAGDNKVSNGGLRSLTVESLGAVGDAAEALAAITPPW